jgi:pimeloyl-ACP methyl ester carboxylesterase
VRRLIIEAAIVVAMVTPAASAGPASPMAPAIYTDPVPDKAFPARMTVLHIPSHDVAFNGVAYLPAGAGPHPTLLICHGLPGNEKNLDLAQAVRRAGWVAITFNYRGSWGSPGTFSFSGNLEDAAAALAYIRDPKIAAGLRIDPKRIAILGHSMGGWVAAKTAARDHGLIGAVLVSAADMARLFSLPHDKVVAEMADDMESLAGVTAESMASEREAHAGDYSMLASAGELASTPLLVLTADDGLAPDADALVKAIHAHGGTHVRAMHVATDHSWSDHRVALESTVVRWIQTLQ